MNWPWVRRTELEKAVAERDLARRVRADAEERSQRAADALWQSDAALLATQSLLVNITAERDALAAELAAERSRYAALALAQPAPPVPATFPKVVQQAIDARIPKHAKNARAALRGWADTALKSESPEAVATAILDGAAAADLEMQHEEV